ncbi:hypothetical protein HFP57_17005 [Parasphingopyxis algicola]|uniref:hypothetical protein n=1 Tax=Parasphingopyxis algicola TaxID=2026624 RepID=UPI0015A3B7AB|nr:hypothetical protein [Parasphingopyxis algicola]QLC26565.1 hypothetical protein HFP57_17005 [Parasphingopyxis algicola]
MNTIATRRYAARAAEADKRHAAVGRDRSTISIILSLVLSVSLSGTLIYEVTRVPADSAETPVDRLV